MKPVKANFLYSENSFKLLMSILYLYLLFFAFIQTMSPTYCSEYKLINLKILNEEQKVKERILDVMEQLDLYGIKKEEINREFKIISIKDDRPNGLRTANCQIGEIIILVETESLRIVEIYNRYLMTKLLKNKASDEEKRTMNFDEMSKTASALVIKIMGESIPNNVKLEDLTNPVVAKFYEVKNNVWLFRWRRYKNDYIYPHDLIVVTISEKHGLESYSCSLASNDVDIRIKIDADKAILQAKNNIKLAVKQFNNTSSEYEKIKAYTYKEVDITPIPELSGNEKKPVIMNVGWLYPASSAENIYTEDIRKAFLCWPVRFFSEDYGDFVLFITVTDGSYIGYEYWRKPGGD
jgi:hypothetical protein